ncbi:hypothetical protein FHETE_759 [Fusarium heterosporum]|uniref:Fungal STAND N-terminal Goodbye domain-containing protein n=1 Tax=Fusarium heterosporum TaxID=42747 RepID=A0A8H5X3B6_FUSHE|nr:hypothetical protein FHETE_759 [Fusarium heterosporum]
MVAKKPPVELEKKLKDDDRDVVDLWKEALKSYQSIVGFDLGRKFDNSQSMLDFGTDQMNNFHKFRHDKGKVDRLRSLFTANLDLIEQGSNQIIAAAAPAFPPAAAIGTALTYLLQACRSVSADYDIIIVFFEDMNSFLTRITILETRLPQQKAYQNCLMEVFTSFLTLCGFAHKYIELGRFKKWISNLFQGDDGDLGGARAGLNKQLEHLQQATEFAILGNTEETLAMASQLDENQKSHAEMLERVGRTIDTIHENTESIRSDMAKLLTLFDGQKKGRSIEKPQANKPPSANGVRNSMYVVPNDDHEYQSLKETLLPDSCGWLFLEPEWEGWLKMPEGRRPVLAITSDPGTGKSHLAAAIHDKLAQTAKGDDTGHTCVAHFYFREQEDSFAFFICGIVTIINQIAETNYAACERLNTQIGRDDITINVASWHELVKYLLAAVFGEDSKFHLYLVFDGLDELRDWPSFKEFVSKFLSEQKLRISLVVTSRPERLDDFPQDTQLVRIKADKKQSQDYRALIWNHINTLGHLKGFSRYVKQRVADKVEEASPNMLYSGHLLLRLNELGREGSVLRALQQEKPDNLHGIYEILLAECQRRMPTKHQEVSGSLLHWIAFSRRLLTFAEVQSLVKHLAQDQNFDTEEIPDIFTKFLKVGGPGYDSEVVARIEAGKATAVHDLKHDEDNNHDSVYDDGPLPVTFKERSMRHYFTNSSRGASVLRWGPSEAHRRILLTSAELLKSRSLVDEGLLKYCALWFVGHWILIKMDEHSPEEQIEVLESVAETLSNKTGLAEMLGKTGISYSNMDTSLSNESAAQWSKLLEKAEIKENLSDFAFEWWHTVDENHSNLRLGIAKGYLQELYRAKNSSDAIEWWNRLQGVLRAALLEKLIIEQAAINFPDHCNSGDEYDAVKAVLGILNLFSDEIKPDATAHRAVAEILVAYRWDAPAEQVCKQALEFCNSSDEEWYRISCVLSNLFLTQKKRKQAYKIAHTAVGELVANKVTPQLKRKVYTTCARAQSKLGLSDHALESYAQAKTSDPEGITPGEDLVDELKLVDKKKDKIDYIQMLKSWSLLERITWIASDYIHEGEERHATFCDIASETGEQEFIVTFYEEAISFLDNLDASTPLLIDLSLIYHEVCLDPEMSLKALDRIFDARANAFRFPILGGTALWMMPRACDGMANVQLELFRRSRDPIYKAERISSLSSVMQRPFALDVPRSSASYTASQRVVLAYMYMVMGPVSKFQETIQSLLYDCFAGLSDSVGWNDAIYFWVLAQTLALMSKALKGDEKLRRYARIVGSAILSRLTKVEEETPGVVDDGKDETGDSGTPEADTPEADDQDKEPVEEADKVRDTQEEDHKTDAQAYDQEHVRAADDQGQDDTSGDEYDPGPPPDDEGDLQDPDDALYSCGGFCYPARPFKWWGNRSAYLYVTYASGMICEDCQAEYDAIESGERTFKGRYFWGLGQDKLKLPIEGWRGIKNGILRVDGEEPISVESFLDKLQNEVCKDAWDRLWAGDAF